MTAYTPRTTSDAMIKPPVASRVTLPALPFAIPPATTDETAPRAPMIRCEMTPEAKDFVRRVGKWFGNGKPRDKMNMMRADELRETMQWVIK